MTSDRHEQRAREIIDTPGAWEDWLRGQIASALREEAERCAKIADAAKATVAAIETFSNGEAVFCGWCGYAPHASDCAIGGLAEAICEETQR